MSTTSGNGSLPLIVIAGRRRSPNWSGSGPYAMRASAGGGGSVRMSSLALTLSSRQAHPPPTSASREHSAHVVLRRGIGAEPDEPLTVQRYAVWHAPWHCERMEGEELGVWIVLHERVGAGAGEPHAAVLRRHNTVQPGGGAAACGGRHSDLGRAPRGCVNHADLALLQLGEPDTPLRVRRHREDLRLRGGELDYLRLARRRIEPADRAAAEIAKPHLPAV